MGLLYPRVGTPHHKACCLFRRSPPPFFSERQMSKRKKATASKPARNPKMAAAQRNKQAIVRSPKENHLRSIATVSTEPPLKLHDDLKHEAPIIAPLAHALIADSRQGLA